MIDEREITLILHPNQPVEARIIALTSQVAEEKLMGEWWSDESLKSNFKTEPIDRHWGWNKFEIDYDDRLLRSEKVAVVTGEGKNLAVQGAMLISTDPVPSRLDDGEQCLFVELLFTAPRNRPDLRMDEQPFLKGVGVQLLIWRG